MAPISPTARLFVLSHSLANRQRSHPSGTERTSTTMAENKPSGGGTPAAGGGAGQQPAAAPAPGPVGGLIQCCCACACCLLCTPLLVLCCCCSGVTSATQKAQGKRWDGKARAWVIDDLAEDAATMKDVPDDDDDVLKLAQEVAEAEAGVAGTASTASTAQAVTVKETEYYDALGVPPDADEKKIKRACKFERWILRFLTEDNMLTTCSMCTYVCN